MRPAMTIPPSTPPPSPPSSAASLLLTQDWPTRDLDALLALAARLEALDRAGTRTALLPDQLAYALFFDNSTRTKSAWAGAAARLGMQPVIVDGSSTQVAHGETAAETGAMLGMNAHALGIRHDLILGEGNRFMRDVKAGIDDYLAATGDRRVVPIVNLQCDVDHPTQTLADLLLAARAAGRPGREEDRRLLGLLAELRQAALGAAGARHAADALRRPRHARAARGLPPDGRADGRGRRQRRGLGRLLPRGRLDGRGLRRGRRRLPEVVGPVRPHAGAGRGEPQGRQGRDGRHREARPRARTPATATGSATSGGWASRRTPSTCTACPPTSAPR